MWTTANWNYLCLSSSVLALSNISLDIHTAPYTSTHLVHPQRIITSATLEYIGHAASNWKKNHLHPSPTWVPARLLWLQDSCTTFVLVTQIVLRVCSMNNTISSNNNIPPVGPLGVYCQLSFPCLWKDSTLHRWPGCRQMCCNKELQQTVPKGHCLLHICNLATLLLVQTLESSWAFVFMFCWMISCLHLWTIIHVV